jgi:hypothetical protein
MLAPEDVPMVKLCGSISQLPPVPPGAVVLTWVPAAGLSFAAEV